VLLTNVSDLSAEQIVSCYESLADIKRRFRVLESDAHSWPGSVELG